MTETRSVVTHQSSPAEIDGRLVELWWEMARLEAITQNQNIPEADRKAAYASLNDTHNEAAPLELAYATRQWARWWWVPNGHIHREYNECSTLWPSTERNLYPAASGMEPEQVVALRGWHVCTTCVPAAPTLTAFRTPGAAGLAEQEASNDCFNRHPAEGSVRWRRAFVTGNCSDCTARGVSVTPLGHLRKHAHARKKADAERRARIEDPKLIGAPDGSPLRVDRDTIRTVQTAKNEYVRHMGYALTGGNAAEHLAHADQIAEALAAKWSITVDQVREQMQPKVNRKLKQYR